VLPCTEVARRKLCILERKGIHSASQRYSVDSYDPRYLSISSLTVTSTSSAILVPSKCFRSQVLLWGWCDRVSCRRRTCQEIGWEDAIPSVLLVISFRCRHVPRACDVMDQHPFPKMYKKVGAPFYLRVNFWPAMTGAAAVDLELALPHIGHAFALYAHFWQYVLPCSIFVWHVEQELAYAAYGFFAALDRSLLFPMPFWPKVAELFVLSPLLEEPAGEP